MEIKHKTYLPLPEDRMDALLKNNDKPLAIAQIAAGKPVCSVVDGRTVIFTPTPDQIMKAKAVPLPTSNLNDAVLKRIRR